MEMGLLRCLVPGLLLAASGAGIASPAFAQGATASSPVEFAQKAEALKPGEWVWAGDVAPEGPVLVYVDLSRQTATVYRNGVRVAVTTVSSGKPGHETPTGVFTILQKDAKHRSSTYNNAPMPYQQRLTWDGVALHAGGLPGYPESHGCVHLPLEFARKLFGITHMGGAVIVSGRAGSVVSMPAAGVIAPADEQANATPHNPLGPGESYRWQPELAPTGPLSVVISATDKRVIVLRNGVEIGRARVELATDDFETHVFVFSRTPEGRAHWTLAGVPGHAGEAGQVLNPFVAASVQMPSAFLAHLHESLAPGAAVLLTRASVLPHHTNDGRSMTVLAAAGD
ncbi:MAG: L,D-transpeptidase [Erythrobacteraceae bacterium]